MLPTGVFALPELCLLSILNKLFLDFLHFLIPAIYNGELSWPGLTWKKKKILISREVLGK